MSFISALLLALLQSVLHVGAPDLSRAMASPDVRQIFAEQVRSSAFNASESPHGSVSLPATPKGSLRASRLVTATAVNRSAAAGPLALDPVPFAAARIGATLAVQRAGDQALARSGARSHAVAAHGSVSPVFLTAPPRQR